MRIRCRWSPAFLLLVWFLAFFDAAAALDMTPGLLFAQMEERTEKIDSLQSDVVLISGPMVTRVKMIIQGPDKFAMYFQDRSMKALFDGEKLWIHLETLNEVFTLDTSGGGGFFNDAIRDWINPKKIITNVTRQTLFTFFNITLLETPESMVASGTIFQGEPGYLLRFEPLGSSLIRKVFEVGYYEMVFSPTTFLPTKVMEYSPGGDLRGIIQVLEYTMNKPVPKEAFVFIPPPGTKEVPLIEVVKQRLQLEKDAILDKVGGVFEGLSNSLKEWGW
jgi:outer membrane lipoprotein-sorting protein